jgi:hypothetical protein
MEHGRTQCDYRTSYECSYVKTVAALCAVDWSRRTAEDCDEYGTIKLELYSRCGFYLRMCAACPTPGFTLKGSNPVHPWKQHL